MEKDSFKKQCSNCLLGTEFSITSDVLCKIKGAVSPDYICSKYRAIPKRTAHVEDNQRKCIKCGFFLRDTSPDSPPGHGMCKIFSVRAYDGRSKNACSKFIGVADRDAV